ncbi:hypothetical protein JCM8547_002883 [Rhodosporidiobolus lusitaniae]
MSTSTKHGPDAVTNKGLNNPSNGGIGGLSIFYGHQFDCANEIISVDTSFIVGKPRPHDRLSIRHPVEPATDLAKSCRRTASLRETFQATFAKLTAAIEQLSLPGRRNLPDSRLAATLSDSGIQLSQAMLNAQENARKYMGSGRLKEADRSWIPYI